MSNIKVETFESLPVNIIIESLDVKFDTPGTVLSTEKVAGELKVLDWKKHKSNWDHITDIEFPVPPKRPIVQ